MLLACLLLFSVADNSFNGPKDIRQIVTLSNHAARAGKSADVLAAKGYRVVGAVGVQLYEKDGGTLTKIVPPKANESAGNGT